ncbi:hypothetical protein OC842_000396 [Tilletia horrida]|uniref:Uncharacterized protein n=1 Tax=Tilletia horrida TaxID=155126 RepID=A0AAN6GHP3_9BASI|nr:hypothetical protein OC842_000396 [Tilletia horrida]
MVSHEQAAATQLAAIIKGDDAVAGNTMDIDIERASQNRIDRDTGDISREPSDGRYDDGEGGDYVSDEAEFGGEAENGDMGVTDSDGEDAYADAEDACSRPVQPWNSKIASARLVRLHNEVATLTPQASDVIRAGLRDVRDIVRTYFRTLPRLRARLQAVCILALRLWKKIARHEVANGDRNRISTPRNYFLSASLHELNSLVSVLEETNFSSLVKRIRNLEDAHEAIEETTINLFCFYHSWSVSIDECAKKSTRASASLFDRIWAVTAVQDAVQPVSDDFDDISGLQPPFPLLHLEVFSLLRAIPRRSTAAIEAAEDASNAKVPSLQDAQTISRLLHDLDARTTTEALEQSAAPEQYPVWRNVAIATAESVIDLAERVETLFKTNMIQEFLLVTFYAMVQLGYPEQASIIGELLVLETSASIGPQGPQSWEDKMALSSALAALSWTYRHCEEGIDKVNALHSAKEANDLALSIEATGLARADFASIRLLQGRTLAQYALAKLDSSDIAAHHEGRKELDRAAIVLRAAVNDDPFGLEAQFALASAFDRFASNGTGTPREAMNHSCQQETAQTAQQLSEGRTLLLLRQKAARTWHEHARAAMQQHSYAEAAESYAKAIEDYRQLPPGPLPDEESKARLVECYWQGAIACDKAYKDGKAITMVGHAIKMCHNPSWLPSLLEHQALLLIKARRYHEALESIHKIDDLRMQPNGQHAIATDTLMRLCRQQTFCELMLGRDALPGNEGHATLRTPFSQGEAASWASFSDNERFHPGALGGLALRAGYDRHWLVWGSPSR